MSVVIVEYPIILLNLKTYEESMGQKAIDFARIAERVNEKTGISIAVAPQIIDIAAVAVSSETPVFAQHIDPVGYGSNTGHVLAEAVKEAGAVGTVINHAENKKDNEFVEKAIARAKEAGLIVMVCAEDVKRAEELAKFNPDLIAVEPPELIGGNISVSTAQPEIITESVKSIKAVNESIDVITGAGIKNREDVAKAIELGTVGVFVASGIVKAEDKKKAVEDMVNGF